MVSSANSWDGEQTPRGRSLTQRRKRHEPRIELQLDDTVGQRDHY